MAWQDGLIAASFRGVPFHYKDNEMQGGRRAVTHEFPLRDTAFVEDLGKKNRSYRIEAYVDGDDYFAQRDALLGALEAGGSGTLAHPYLGQLTVQVLTFKLTEKQSEGRAAFFEINFVDAGSVASPTSSTDTAGGAISACGDANEQLQTSFGLSFSLLGFPLSVFEAVFDLIETLSGALFAVLSNASSVTSVDSAAYLTNLSANVGNPTLLAADVVGFCSAFANDVANSFVPFDDTLSSRGPELPSDPSYGLFSLASWGATLAPLPTGTPAQMRAADNQAAIVSLVQGSAAVALVALYTNTTFTSEEAAEAARDQVIDLLDDLMLAASNDGDDAAVASYASLATATTIDLTKRGKQLPDVVTYTLAGPLPSLALAQRFYGDATRAGELIGRNGAIHPLFFPPSVEALSA
jgi:prophage DNA circulation protein